MYESLMSWMEHQVDWIAANMRRLPLHAWLAMGMGYALMALVVLALVSSFLQNVGLLTTRGDEPSRLITVGDCYMMKQGK